MAEDEIEEVVMADAPGGDTEITKEGEAETHTYLTPSELQSHLQQVWEHDGALLQQVYALFRMNMAENEVPTDIFFLRIIPVTPTRFRPVSMGPDFCHVNSLAPERYATFFKILFSNLISATDIITQHWFR